MTPLLNQRPGSAEELYTKALCSARNCSERGNGEIKALFEILGPHSRMLYEPQKACKIINACSVLNNKRINHFLNFQDEQFIRRAAQLQQYEENLGNLRFLAPNQILNEGRLIQSRVVNLFRVAR